MKKNTSGENANISKCSLMKKDKMLFYAQKILGYNNFIIKQCDSWLSEENGLKNTQMRIK